jgi:transcription termination factor Rho
MRNMANIGRGFAVTYMQTYYWQILIDEKPWHNVKIWNEASAKVIHNKVKRDIENHIDYKGEKVELAKRDEVKEG